MEKLLYVLAIIGALAVAFQFFDILVKYLPYFQKLKFYTWDKLSHLIKLNILKKKAIASGVENALNQMVFELRNELPKGWINRASIQWVGKNMPANLKDKQLILRIKPQDDQDINYLNAIYYFFSSSIFPKTSTIVPVKVKRAVSLYLSKRTIQIKHPYLSDNFDTIFLEQFSEQDYEVAGYYGDYVRIDEYGFFGSAFIREVDTLADSLRFSLERQNIEFEIKNILVHLMKFEKLKISLQEDEWYKKLTATSYGFLLVARPEEVRHAGVTPYIKRAKQRLKLGIKRLYVIGCYDEYRFVKEVISELTEIKEYRLSETFSLYKDYRGEYNGLGALFIIDTLREGFRKQYSNLYEQEQENEENDKSILESGLTTNSSVIIGEHELVERIKNVILLINKKNDWVYLGQIGEKLKQNMPLFNPQHYGCSSLRQLLSKLEKFELKEEDGTAVYVKIIDNSEVNNVKEKLIVDDDHNNQVQIDAYLNKTINDLCQKEEWVYLGKLGERIRNDYPEFEPEQYGAPTLTHLLKRLDTLEIKKEGLGPLKSVYVRVKSNENNSISSILEQVVLTLSKKSGWAYLGNVGKILKQKDRDFDPQNYGSASLRHLLESQGKFEIREEGEGTAKSVFVRLKSRI